MSVSRQAAKALNFKMQILINESHQVQLSQWHTPVFPTSGMLKQEDQTDSRPSETIE